MTSKSSENRSGATNNSKPKNTTPFPDCPNCTSGNHVIRYGNRQTKTGPIQVFRCRACNKNFTTRALKHTMYSNRIILEALSTYNLGYTQKETVHRVNKRNRSKITQPSLSNWLKRYSDICTFNRLRKKYAIDPRDIIVKKKFRHQQVYDFKYHTLKLNIAAKRYPGVRDYINEVQSSLDSTLFESGPRCSSPGAEIKRAITSNILPAIKVIKTGANNATKIASLSMELARNNRERHSRIQNFFLINDYATFAIEVPVYLRPDEVKSLHFPLSAPLTGHIDLLQMRRGRLHILDYKPDAAFDTNTRLQLLLYSLLLSKRTNIPLENFTCAYFDDSNYYQFKPLGPVEP